MDKRKFLKSASAATVLAAFGVSLSACSEDENPTSSSSGGSTVDNTVDLNDGSFSSLQADGAWVLHPSRNILLVNVGGTISAFTSVCTHTGCSRDWSFGSNAVCTCHGSEFNVEGEVVTGPATRGLSRVSVSRDGDILTVG